MTLKWKTDKLGRILKTTSGGTPLRSNKTFYVGTIPWLKSGELNDNMQIDASDEHINEEAIKNSSAKLFPENSVLIALYGATAGKLGILKISSTSNQAVCAILPNDNFLPKIIYYFLLFKRQFIIKQGKGGAQPNISQTVLKDLDFPIISLGEQQQIVDEIEKQFTRLDTSVKNLKSVKDKLEVYRKSVLKSAFDIDIKEEKIINYCKVISGSTPKTSKKEYWDGDILWITPKDLSGYNKKSIGDTSRKITKEGYESCSTTLIPKNNVLMSSRAPIGYLVINEKPMCTNQGFKSFKINNPNILLGEFLYYQLKNIVEKIKKSGSGTTFNEISKTKAENIMIKVPSIKIQQKIVEEIESHFSVIDKLEQTVDSALLKTEQLRKSILKSAFEGKLVKEPLDIHACDI